MRPNQQQVMSDRFLYIGYLSLVLEVLDKMVSEKRIKEIIVEQLGVEEDQITSDASFIDDLGADSLDTVELVMAFEEEFDIEIPDEDAEKIRTVRDVVNYLNAHLE